MKTSPDCVLDCPGVGAARLRCRFRPIDPVVGCLALPVPSDSRWRSTATSRTGHFQMNRVARFVWAFIGTAAMQKGPLWWAGHHVNHHRFADREGDPHSPMVSGIYHAQHRLVPVRCEERQTRADQSGHPRLLEVLGDSLPEHAFFVPPLLLALAMLDWRIHVARVGFCLPTVTLAHSTFAINTVNHLFGSRRFDTIDESRNNPFTAFFAVGEGWHNNHHRYQRSARNGFYWWEFDPTWHTIRLMQMVGPRLGRAAGSRAYLRRSARDERTPQEAQERQRHRRRWSDRSRTRGRLQSNVRVCECEGPGRNRPYALANASRA